MDGYKAEYGSDMRTHRNTETSILKLLKGIVIDIKIAISNRDRNL
jgi:hypothetical protein